MAVIYLPDPNVSVLQIPFCTEPVRGVGEAHDEPVEGSKIVAVLRDPLERFQEFHRTYWIESKTGLPKSLRRVGFQDDWPIALVAGHTAAIASANLQMPDLVELGPYSPQSAFWPQDGEKPAFVLYDQLGYDWEHIVGGPVPVVQDGRRRYSPAAIVGDLRGKLEQTYAVDLAVYNRVAAERREETRRVRSLLG